MGAAGAKPPPKRGGLGGKGPQFTLFLCLYKVRLRSSIVCHGIEGYIHSEHSFVIALDI